jgi:hypothetical protein
MSTINASSIQRVLADSDQITFALLLDSGAPCKPIGIEELRALSANGHVCARWRGGKILSVQLIVPADEAFGRLAQTARKVRESLHSSNASQTTQRAYEGLPQHIRKHHAAHCSAWGGVAPGVGRGRPVDARAV